MNKKPPRVDATQLRSKNIEFQHELRNGRHRKHHIIIWSNKVRQLNHQQESEIEVIVSNTNSDDETKRNGGKRAPNTTIEDAELCGTIQKNAKEDIRKCYKKSPRKVRRAQTLGQEWLVTLLDSRVENSMILESRRRYHLKDIFQVVHS